MIVAGGIIEVRVDFVSEDKIIAVSYDSGDGAVYHGILLPELQNDNSDGIVGVNRDKYDQWKRAQSDLIGLSSRVSGFAQVSPSETSSLALRQTYFQNHPGANSSKPETPTSGLSRRKTPNGILSRSVRVVRLRPTQGLCTKCCVPLHTGKNSEFHYPGFSKKQLKSPIKKVKEERKFLSPVRNQPNFNSSNFVKVAKSPATVDPSPVSLPIMTEANVKPVNSLMLTTTTTTSTSVPTTPNETVLINSSGSPAIPKLKITFGTKRKKTLTIVGGEKSTFITQNDCDSAVMAKGDRLANATIEKPAVKRPLSRSSSVDSLDELKPLVIDYEEPEEEIMPVSTIPLNEPLMSNRTSVKNTKDSSTKKKTFKSDPSGIAYCAPVVPNSSVVVTSGDGTLEPAVPKIETFPLNPHNVKPKEIVWAKMSSCPWWPAEIYALYPMEVSPVQQSVCVIWIDAANEHGFLDVRTQVEPFLPFFKKRYNRKRNSPGYQVSIGQALKQTKEQMGTEAFDKYEKDIVGLVSNECLKAFGYSDLRKHRSLLSPTDSPKVQKGKSPQEKQKSKRGRKPKVETSAASSAGLIEGKSILSPAIVTAELDSTCSNAMPSCSSTVCESNGVELSSSDDFTIGQNCGEIDSPLSSLPTTISSPNDTHYGQNGAVVKATAPGEDVSLFDSVLTQLQQINELCDNTSATKPPPSACKLSCT